MPDHLKVQLRTFRQASGLLQEDLAHLLGFKNVSSVSRLEKGEREPDLRTAFAFEYALGASASALFGSIFADITRTLSARAREQLDALSRFANDVRHADRLTHLTKLAEKPRTLFDV